MESMEEEETVKTTGVYQKKMFIFLKWGAEGTHEGPDKLFLTLRRD